MTSNKKELETISKQAMQVATEAGAAEAAASTFKRRRVRLSWRDGKVEQISESTEKGLTLSVYVDGRYSAVSTSDLRKEALKPFIEDSIQFAKVLAKDPFRSLPDPKYYKGQITEDLHIEDQAYSTLTPQLRRELVQRMEKGARSGEGSGSILSVSTGFNDSFTEEYRVHSNGFEGHSSGTAFSNFVSVSGKDADGRRPQEYAYSAKRHFSDLPEPEQVGKEASERVMRRMGSRKFESGQMGMILDHRAVGRFLGNLQGPMSGRALQQKQSCFEGMKGKAIGSTLWTLVDNPHVTKGLGSRYFDNEGMAAHKIPIVEHGVLKNYYIDHYYGKKLSMTPTTGSPSNLEWMLGKSSKQELIKSMSKGIYVTGFIGGNSNSTTGDFSLGIQGFYVENGAIQFPVSEMNISGNLTSFWHQLVAVGNDPYPYSAMQTPTLVFDKVEFAGT